MAIDERARPLLDFIAAHESEPAAKAQGVASGYDVVWGGISRPDRPTIPLTGMKVSEVLQWQREVTASKGYASSASGRYQIIRKTLEGLNLDPGAFFNSETQDRAAYQLLIGRGWDRFITGGISAETFANHLAKEWAALPVVSGDKKGRSYYDGDGINTARTTPSAVLKTLASISKAAPVKPVPEQKEPIVKYVGYEKAWAAVANLPAGAFVGILAWWGIASAGLLESAPPEELVIGSILGLGAQAWSAIKVYATPSPTYNRPELGGPTAVEDAPRVLRAVPQPEPPIVWPGRRDEAV